MLMSAGLPLPRQVFAHGFVYNKGAKISKSAGTAIDPMDVFRRHGADAFRYYFMRECPFGGDGNFSEERFAEVYNSDLANNLGNLYSRVLADVRQVLRRPARRLRRRSTRPPGSPGSTWPRSSTTSARWSARSSTTSPSSGSGSRSSTPPTATSR